MFSWDALFYETKVCGFVGVREELCAGILKGGGDFNDFRSVGLATERKTNNQSKLFILVYSWVWFTTVYLLLYLVFIRNLFIFLTDLIM